MNWNDIKNNLRVVLRGGRRVIEKIRSAVETDGLITLIVLIAWLFVQRPEEDIIKTIIVWQMNIAAGIALVVRWVQVRYRTRSVGTRYKDAKEEVKMFNKMAFTLAMLCVIFFVFRHLLRYGPEFDVEIVVGVILFLCVTMMTMITKMSDRT